MEDKAEATTVTITDRDRRRMYPTILKIGKVNVKNWELHLELRHTLNETATCINIIM